MSIKKTSVVVLATITLATLLARAVTASAQSLSPTSSGTMPILSGATAVTFSGNSTISSAGVTIDVGAVQYLIVGGGGGGGAGGNDKGGGGGGGYLVAGYSNIPSGTTAYTVTVGSGGSAGVSGSTTGGTGGSSYITSMGTAAGGGGGLLAKAGGNSGETIFGSTNYWTGGGTTSYNAGSGGAGSGTNGNIPSDNTTGGIGGNGATSSITGTSVGYGGGGGGYGNVNKGLGGSGGGGNGAWSTSALDIATSGAANSGGGGGGGSIRSGTTINGAAGGSGVVFVQYYGPSNAITVTAGGSVTNTSSSDYTYAQFNSSGTLGVASTTQAAIFSGNLSGSGGLTVAGPGTLTLTGSNSYSGGTTINAGILNISADTALGGSSGTLTFTGNGTLQAGGVSVALGASRPIVLNNGVTGTLDTNGNTMSVAGTISGSGSVTKSGNGALSLSALNTFSGNVTVRQGTLSVNSLAANGSAQPLGEGSSAISIGLGYPTTGTGTLQYTGPGGQTLDRNIFIPTWGQAVILNNGSDTLTLGSGTSNTITFQNNGTFIASNLTLSGSQSIVVNSLITDTSGWPDKLTVDTTTVTLNQANTYCSSVYPANTNVYNGGTLKNGIDNALPAATTLSLGNAANTNGTYDLNAYNQTLAGITSMGSGTQIIQNSGASGGTKTLQVSGGGSFGGVIQDGTQGIALTIAGGTLTLSGSNSYSGGTTVSNGMLVAANVLRLCARRRHRDAQRWHARCRPRPAARSRAWCRPAVARIRIAPGAGLSSGYGTLNLNGGLNTNANTTLAFNLNLGRPDQRQHLRRRPDQSGRCGVERLGAISPSACNPSNSGDYRLIGGTFGSPTWSNFAAARRA